MWIFKCFQHSLQRYTFSRKTVFLIDVVVLCWHNAFGIIAITVTVHQLDTPIKLPDHQFVYRIHRPFLSFYDVVKRSRKLLDLDGNMLM